MRLLKKVVAVGMASTMVFSMAGCGSKTAETPTTSVISIGLKQTISSPLQIITDYNGIVKS